MSKKNEYNAMSLYGSCALLLFSGIILGGLMEPWGLDIRNWIILLGVILFIIGFFLLSNRERKNMETTKTRFEKLEQRIEELENNSRSDNE